MLVGKVIQALQDFSCLWAITSCEYGGDRVAGLMNAFRVEDDMPIESPNATRSLKAQKKVETYYFDIRKQVFEYDEVMNNQRRCLFRKTGQF